MYREKQGGKRAHPSQVTITPSAFFKEAPKSGVWTGIKALSTSGAGRAGARACPIMTCVGKERKRGEWVSSGGEEEEGSSSSISSFLPLSLEESRSCSLITLIDAQAIHGRPSICPEGLKEVQGRGNAE